MYNGFINQKINWLPEEVWKNHEGREILKRMGGKVTEMVSGKINSEKFV